MKKIVIAVIALFILLCAAALIAPYFIPGTAFKGPLISQLQRMTGRTLTIDGKFDLRLFPTAGVYMENVTLSNPPGYMKTAPFMKLKSLNVSVSLIPLLSGKVHIKSLVLEEPQINLHVNAGGVNNWQFTPAGSKAEASASTGGDGGTVLPRDLLLNGVAVKNGDVTYASDITKQHWEVQNLNGDVSLNGIASPFELEGEGKWNAKTVSIKARLDSLQSFLSHTRTAIDASLNSEPLTIETHGAIDRGMYYVGKASVKSSSLKTVLAWLNPGSKPLATPAPLALAITGDTECSPGACTLSNANLTLDNLKAKGTVKVSQGPERPAIGVDLVTGKLDLNPFLPPAQHAENMLHSLLPDANAAAPAGVWSSEPIDFSALRSFDLMANLKTDGIALHSFETGKATVNAKLQHAQLGVDLVDADMYGGKGNFTVNIDDRGALPMVETRSMLHGIQLQPLLKAVAGIDRFTGTADIDANTAAYGRSEKDLISGLSGRGQAKVTGGTIEGVNLDDMVHNIQSAFLGGGSQKTVFNDMSGSFMINQGVISNQDLVMNSATLHISGKGTVNLPLQTISYRLTPQMVTAATKTEAAKQGVGVPVLVEGSLNHPTFRPDLAAVVQKAITNPKEFKQELKNSRGQIKDQLKELKGLKNLFKKQ